ncbi:MAG: hypothetical protein HY688_03165 [Chloroflexi bacterium]|nr:hypothetical protein [Chloroflexota bacterium]
MAPILAAVAAFAFSTGGFFSAFLAFLLFALTMAALMLVISVLVALSPSLLSQRLRAASGTIQRTASIVLVAVGLSLVYLSVDLETTRALFLRWLS